MNGARKFKSLRLVRFGDVLYDQQRRLIMLCRSCQRHYLCLDSFQAHLSKCLAIKHIVASIDELQYDEERRETRLVNGKQELFIYEPDAVRTDKKCDIDWEAELEDPRWYTEDARILPNKPTKPSPANAKENVAKTRTRSQVKDEGARLDQTSLLLPPKRVRHSSPKRTILTNQQQQSKSRSLSLLPSASAKTKANEVYVVKNVVEDLKNMDALPTVRAPAIVPMVSIPFPAGHVANGDTQQILNKLRACGVEVKRRNTRETVESAADASAIAKKQQALDIMRKLQSNGIKCTKVNKHT